MQYNLIGEGEDLLNDIDVHIHFPEGAVGKDGPSAGVTAATALISLFAGIPVATDIALTGEITLLGVVLPVSFASFNSFIRLWVKKKGIIRQNRT